MTVTDRELNRFLRRDNPPTPTGAELAAAAVFAGLASDLAAAPDTNRLLAGVLEFAVRQVECDWATIQLAGQETAMVASSDPLAPARADGSVVAISDTGIDQRLPHWNAHLVGLGVRSVLVTRLTSDGSTLGTLAFHAAEPGSFGAADQATARLIAAHAAIALAALRQATTLAAAIESRTVIGQAQGIAMERYGLDRTAAFALLRRYSQDSNLKLRDVAETLATTRQLPGHHATPTG